MYSNVYYEHSLLFLIIILLSSNSPNHKKEIILMLFPLLSKERTGIRVSCHYFLTLLTYTQAFVFGKKMLSEIKTSAVIKEPSPIKKRTNRRVRKSKDHL